MEERRLHRTPSIGRFTVEKCKADAESHRPYFAVRILFVEIIKVTYSVEITDRPEHLAFFRAPFEYEIDGQRHQLYAYWSHEEDNPTEEQVDARARITIENMLREMFGESAVYNLTRVENLR